MRACCLGRLPQVRRAVARQPRSVPSQNRVVRSPAEVRFPSLNSGMFSHVKAAILSRSCLGASWARMRSKCRYSARKQTETPRHTAAFADRALSCSGIGNLALNALPLCTRFRKCFAGTIAPLLAPKHTRETAFQFRSGVETPPLPTWEFEAAHRTWISRSISIQVLPFEDHARWHFLEESAIWRSTFCREQNRNGYSAKARSPRQRSNRPTSTPIIMSLTSQAIA